MTPTDAFFTPDALRDRARLAMSVGNPGRAKALTNVARAVEGYTDNDSPLIITDPRGEVVEGTELPDGCVTWGVCYIRDGSPVLLITSSITDTEKPEEPDAE